MRRILVTCALGLMPACVPDGAPPLHNHSGLVGDACTEAADCSDGFMCMSGNFFDFNNLDTPGGYCTLTCSSDADCHSQKCVAGGGGTSYCMRTCSDGSGCRDQYACFAPGECEPSMYLNCDPGQAACTTGNNNPGGCLRLALGSGVTGQCRADCVVGASICDAGFACLVFDENPDPFLGTVCWPLLAAPTADGASCTFVDECVNGDECVKSAGVQACRRLCNPKQGLGCPAGKTCQDTFGLLNSTSSPVGVCL